MRSMSRFPVVVVTAVLSSAACGPFVPCNPNTVCPEDEICVENLCIGIHEARQAGLIPGEEEESNASSSSGGEGGSNEEQSGSNSSTSSSSSVGTSSTPIILDLSNSGALELTHVTMSTVRFDLDADGVLDQVAWTHAQGNDTDGFLALDRNHNGIIDNGLELFGNQHGAANGFDELSLLDTNLDGLITPSDVAFDQLLVWQDRNGNGISEQQELTGMLERGLTSVSVGYVESSAVDSHGNGLFQQGAFTTQSGEQGLAVDAWLGIWSVNLVM